MSGILRLLLLAIPHFTSLHTGYETAYSASERKKQYGESQQRADD
jgi:hypothetical protein